VTLVDETVPHRPAVSSLTAEEQIRLVDRIRGGDAAAEDELVRTFQRPVLALLVARTRDREACRDLAQETFMAVLTAVRAGRLREAAKLAAFVSGTARNLALKFIRSRRTQPLPADEAPEPRSPAPEADLEAEERAVLVAQALDHLEDSERQVLSLTWLDGLAPRQIARRLGVSSDVVRTRKSRALKKVVDYVRGRTRTRPPGDPPSRGEPR
jgi:RNA polymerase sigma-70 factor (ECF subfamily)